MTPKRRPRPIERRMLPLRLTGLCLGAVAVASVLYQHQSPPALWLALAFNALGWPFVAYVLTRRGTDPARQEQLNLVLDSMLGGAWIAIMHLKPAPSLLLLMTLSMGALAYGGWRFLLRTAAAQIVAFAVTWAMVGFKVDPKTSFWVTMACAPHLLVYPLLVASASHHLLRTVDRQRRKISQLARLDPLTGVLNRSHWEEVAQYEINRFRRSGMPSALLLMDMDRFKTINDRHGHLAGDHALQAFAKTIRDAIRITDTPGRFGGDEFIVILPNTSADEALGMARRIAERTRQIDIGLTERPVLSSSIGICILDGDVKSASYWVACADRALLRAKAAGRDCVEINRVTSGC